MVLGFGTQCPALDHTLRAFEYLGELFRARDAQPRQSHHRPSSLLVLAHHPPAHLCLSSVSLNHRSWQYAYNAVLCTISMIYLSSILIYAAYVIYSARKIKKLNKNVTSTVLIWVTLAALFHWLWHAGVYTSNVIQQSSRPMIVFQKPVTIPGFSIFETWAFLSFPLMYDEPCKECVSPAQDTTAPLLPHTQPTLSRILNSTICDASSRHEHVSGCLCFLHQPRSLTLPYPLSFSHSLFHTLTLSPCLESRAPPASPTYFISLAFHAAAPCSLTRRWMQIVSSSKSMSSAGANLNKKFLAAIAILCSTVGILFLVLGLLGLTFITSALGAVCFLAVVIMYFIGSFQLLKLTGKTNRMAIAVASLTRQIACSLGIAILCTVSCKILSTTFQ